MPELDPGIHQKKQKNTSSNAMDYPSKLGSDGRWFSGRRRYYALAFAFTAAESGGCG